jgi:hypothetical protein
MSQQYRGRINRIAADVACMLEDQRLYLEANMAHERARYHNRRSNKQKEATPELQLVIDLPECHRPLNPKDCDKCRGWQDFTHDTFLDSGFDQFGRRTTWGLLFEVVNETERWPLARETRELMKEIPWAPSSPLPRAPCHATGRGRRLLRLRRMVV